jgi:hypothetical protein
MRHDLFDLKPDMTTGERAWRIALLLALTATLLMDLFLWRPL